jgi:hypothetical protein
MKERKGSTADPGKTNSTLVSSMISAFSITDRRQQGYSMQRKTITSLITLVFLLAIMILPVAAQAAVHAELQVPDGQFTVGDPIPLTLVVSHPADYQVIPPTLGDNLGKLIIRGQTPLETIRNVDGTATTTQTIDTRLFAPGEFEIPALAINISDGAGNLTTVQTPLTKVSIASVLNEADTELRDIKPQAELPYMNSMPWIVAATAASLLIVVGYLIWRRKQKRIALSQLDNRLPHEVVLDELNRVQGLRLPDEGRFKEHYTLISDVMREYAERIFKLPVVERTTIEVEISLKAIEVDTGLAKSFIDILDESDMVKFAKVIPSIDRAYLFIERSRQFVDSTKSEPTEEDELEKNDDLPHRRMININNTRIYPPTEVTP